MTAASFPMDRRPRGERGEWFWIFVIVSVALHLVLLVRTTGEKPTVTLEAAPAVMAVQLVEVRPAPPAPAVVEPVVEKVVEPEPVITRVEEPVPVVEPPKVEAAPPKPVPVKKTVTSAPPQPAAPALVEARPVAHMNRPPAYPEMARRNGWQGLCMVRVTVGADGKVGGVSLAKSSGFGILDQAALAAVKRWKFSPRQTRGVASASTVEVPVNFSLR